MSCYGLKDDAAFVDCLSLVPRDDWDPNDKMRLLTIAVKATHVAQRAEGDASIYEWMLNNPSDVMLAYFEATNDDTFGGKPPSKEQQVAFLRERLPELQSMNPVRP